MYVISDKLIITPDYYRGFTLVFSGRTGVIKRFYNSFWKKLTYEQRWGGYIKKRPELDSLIKSKFLVPKNEDEKTETIRENIRLNNCRQELSWVIMPSADCNVACDYCPQNHSSATLSRENCNAILKKLKKTLEANNYTELHIGWFGGEPLLGIDVIRYLTPHFITICKIHSVEYKALVETNGTLLTKTIGQELINDLRVRKIDITMDGARKTHNAIKLTRNNQSTYDIILKNLSDFVKINSSRPPELYIRCNVDLRNVNYVEEWIDDLALISLSKSGLLYFGPIQSWAKANGQKFALRMEAYAEHEARLLEYAYEKGFSVIWLPTSGRSVCIHSLKDSIVFAPDGQLYNCLNIPLVPAYQQSEKKTRWHEGSLLNDTFSHEQSVSNKRMWNQEVLEGKRTCGNCKLLGVCGGACPRKWYDGGTGCPSFKFNIIERMKFFSKFNLPVIPRVGLRRKVLSLIETRSMKSCVKQRIRPIVK